MSLGTTTVTSDSPSTRQIRIPSGLLSIICMVMAVSAINYLPPFASSLIMHVLTNAEKLIPLRDAASLAESRRLAGIRMVTGTTSPSTRYERISVSPASCSIRSEYVIASHAFKPQYKCINYTPAWEQRKLGDVADLLTGYPFESRHFTDTGIPLVRGMNVKRGYLDMSADICENWSDAAGVEDYLLKAGDIVIQMDGALIGSSYAMVTPENTPSLLVQRVTRVRCGNRSRYIFQAVQRGFLRYIKSLKTETAVPHLSLSDIADYAIPVPKEEREQEHIGSFFSRLDDLITLHQRKRESRIIRVRSFIWLAGDISGIGVSAYQPEKRRPYDRRQHQRRNVVLRLLRAMDQRIQGRCNS
ncbi:restriction endonuclease subunit S [Bifidobacterium bifidum]|nr:restriction endonuclease subunit S [Bifidobacterium bifidum]